MKRADTRTNSARPRQARDRKGGFTLVELLVVLVILALIMGLVGPRVLNYLTSSRERTAALQISSFKAAMDLFFLDAGRYPTATEGLGALIEKPSTVDTWSGPYLQQTQLPSDPWGNPYRYVAPTSGSPYGIISLGADGTPGGTGSDADITGN